MVTLSTSPLVSIIMNCYNGERYLREAIDSVYAQNYENFEIIFWDNASTDSSAEIAESYDSRLRYFRSRETYCLGKARNLAIAEVRGEYLTFLDTDDLFLPGKLTAQVALMQQGLYGMVYSGMDIINAQGNRIRKVVPKHRSGNLFSDLLRRYEINMPTVLIDMDVVRQHKLSFREDLFYSPDYHLFMHIAANAPVGVMSERLVCYRFHDNSLTGKTLQYAPKEQRFTLKALREKYPKLVRQYQSEFDAAHSQACFAEVRYLISIGEKRSARKMLRKILFRDVRFLILYLSLLLPTRLYNMMVSRLRINMPLFSG